MANIGAGLILWILPDKLPATPSYSRARHIAASSAILSHSFAIDSHYCFSFSVLHCSACWLQFSARIRYSSASEVVGIFNASFVSIPLGKLL
jgi:hypothetical protein